MRVKHLSLTNFRGFASLELDLDRPVTVLIGVNGAGKTSVLRAVAASITTLQNVSGIGSSSKGAPLDQRDLRSGTDRSDVRCQLADQSFDSTIALRALATAPAWDGGASASLEANSKRNGSRLFGFFVGTERQVPSAWVPTNSNTHEDNLGVLAKTPGYGRFLNWFKEREDAENARRVARADLTLEDPQLRAVRTAVAALMPGFEKLRIDRDQAAPAMVVTKNSVELRLDQLSDGERNLLALAGDLARRMVIADPANESPLETEGVILIDEVEQHLHPAWQREVIPALQRAFPRAQLIVTTHSPQVLSSVPASAVVVLDGERATTVEGTTRGRDTNAILREVFGVPERPADEQREVLAIAALIDQDRIDDARARLLQLAARLTEHDDAVLRLRTRLDFAEAGL
jgi:predicted ATP-binding protein involved in virulence